MFLLIFLLPNLVHLLSYLNLLFIKFPLFQEQLFTVEAGAIAHTQLPFHVLTFTNKNIQ